MTWQRTLNCSFKRLSPRYPCELKATVCYADNLECLMEISQASKTGFKGKTCSNIPLQIPLKVRILSPQFGEMVAHCSVVWAAREGVYGFQIAEVTCCWDQMIDELANLGEGSNEILKKSAA